MKLTSSSLKPGIKMYSFGASVHLYASLGANKTCMYHLFIGRTVQFRVMETVSPNAQSQSAAQESASPLHYRRQRHLIRSDTIMKSDYVTNILDSRSILVAFSDKLRTTRINRGEKYRDTKVSNSPAQSGSKREAENGQIFVPCLEDRMRRGGSSSPNQCMSRFIRIGSTRGEKTR